MTTEQKEWLTFQEAAEYLGVSYPRFTTKVKEGVYPVHSVPGFSKKKRISRSTLDEMMNESKEEAVG